ncbi:12818_t:CDS:10 [Ambispora leptoticha]|uniref:Vacuolar protein sorting-associated protein 41 n=1 Tax=Ambispora leptoticha TaxID=144679 RepID=A0A9N8ZVV7_9GLOM|nr:12818_t:CDS:10 [Ambispora leptoticha]
MRLYTTALKYQRLGAGVGEILKRDAASAMAVSDRFVVLGTHNGAVLLFDFEGNEIKRFSAHTATVHDLSVDVAGEYVASASMDGRVVINGLYNEEVRHYNYKRPLKCVALDPNFTRNATGQFVSGGLAGQLILHEKGWFGSNVDTILHQGEGPIYAVKWRGSLIAWANDMGVKMYDMNSKQRITWICRPDNSPRPDLYRCHLCWRNDTHLLIGWADHVQVGVVKERTRMENTQGPSLYVEIIALFRTDFIVCGIAPFKDMMLLMAYITDDIIQNEETSNPEQQRRPRAKRPELRIINSSNEEISSDALSLHSFQQYQANDYVLDFLPSDEDLFYVVSPKDLVVAKPRDLDDHIGWLLDRLRYEEALGALREAQAWGGSKTYDVTEVGLKYLSYLIDKGEYEKAAMACPTILKTDSSKWDEAKLWDDWIFKFAELRQLQEITPYIPFKDPQLSSVVYEMVLAYFLNQDYESLYSTIKRWPPTIYNIQSVIVAVEDALFKDADNPILMECLAELYTFNREPDKALEYSLRLRRPNVFDLIRDYGLFSSIEDKIVLLMEFDQHLLSLETKESIENKDDLGEPTEKPSPKLTPIRKPSEGPAVQLLVQNTESVPISRVVKQLQKHPKFMFIYLDALFLHDPHMGYEYHDLQVELYAEYEPSRLMEFLRNSNYYSLEKAYKVCEQRDLVPEMVFILGRTGNNKEALMLIIDRLQDVQRAIDFAKEQEDDALWEDLLKLRSFIILYIIGFIKVLLENLGGTDIDPIRLISQIPDDLEIPGLKDALIKILQDFNLQASLREGCERILVSDSVAMADQLQRAQKRGTSCGDDLVCSVCQELIIIDDIATKNFTAIIFFCRHAYHESCLLEDESPSFSETAARIKGKQYSVGAKVVHSTLLRSLGSPPQCPICNDAQHLHGAKQKDKKALGNVGIVRRNRASPSIREEDGMPPMVTLRL